MLALLIALSHRIGFNQYVNFESYQWNKIIDSNICCIQLNKFYPDCISKIDSSKVINDC